MFQSFIIIVLVCKTILFSIKYKNFDSLSFQWNFTLIISYLNYLLSEHLTIPLFPLCQIGLICSPDHYLSPLINFYQTFPIDSIIQEIKFHFTVTSVKFTINIFKRIIQFFLTLIDEEQLNEVKQNKIQQSLLDITQFIEGNNFVQYTNRTSITQSQQINQTLQLDITQIQKIEKHDEDDPFNQTNILQELDSPLNQTSSKKQIDQMRSTLDKLKSERKSIELNSEPKLMYIPTEHAYTSARPIKSVRSFTQQSTEKNEIFEKLKACKDKIKKQQIDNLKQL